MAKKGNRPGRRALNKRIEQLAKRAAGNDRVDKKCAALFLENAKFFRKIEDLEREVVKARDSAKSITEMIGGFKLHLYPPGYDMRRFNEWRLQISIRPEVYSEAFFYGSGDRFRNFSSFIHMTSMDVARQVEKVLLESADKMTGGVRGGY